MKFMIRLSVLLALGVPVFFLFLILIAFHGDEGAQELADGIHEWLTA